MKHTWCVIGVCAALPLLADTRLDVSQLAGTITSALAVDRNDKRIARSLNSVRLTERLSAEAAELLVKMGTGPATARALDALRKQSAGLPAPAQDALSISPVPSESEQHEMIDRMRGYVSVYLAQFPDFIATKAVRQYHNYKSFDKPSSFFVGGWSETVTSVDDRWYAAGAYTADAAYVAGRAYHRGTAANDKRERTSRVSHGEFGAMLEEIFDPSRAAWFAWDRWQTLNGTRTAVFGYQVAPEFSRYSVCCRTTVQPDNKRRQEYVKAGHRGFVFADPRSGAVMRLILYATGPAGEADTIAAGNVLEYGDVSIGESRYLLPVRSTAYVRIGEYESREEIEYRNYHKFSSEAAISFTEDAGDGEGMPAIGHSNAGAMKTSAEPKPDRKDQ
jgi:hypothetical protein